MLITLAADHEKFSMVKLLEIDEDTGKIKINFVDTTSQDDLIATAQLLKEGTSFSDFQVVEVPDTENKGATRGYELRHQSSNIVDLPPDLDLDQMTLEEDNSFVGLIRRVIANGGKIVLPLHNVPEDNIPHWMVASANALQISKEMKGHISYQYPGSKPGYWRWSSAPIFYLDNDENFNDITKIKLLVSEDFELGSYSDYVNESGNINVMNEAETSVISYKVLMANEKLPVFGQISNLLMLPSIISRFKFIADSYKLALYQLTAGLFEERKTEYNDSADTAVPKELGRHVYLASKPTITRATSEKMMDYLMKELMDEERPSRHSFSKTYPHYEAFHAIILDQTPYFQSEEVSKSQKFRRYNELKNIETQFYIMMNECLYDAMFNNNSFQFNYWGDTGTFKSDIPNYKVTLAGGGGKWRRNPMFF